MTFKNWVVHRWTLSGLTKLSWPVESSFTAPLLWKHTELHITARELARLYACVLHKTCFGDLCCTNANSSHHLILIAEKQHWTGLFNPEISLISLNVVLETTAITQLKGKVKKYVRAEMVRECSVILDWNTGAN